MRSPHQPVTPIQKSLGMESSYPCAGYDNQLYHLSLPFSNASRGYGIPLWGVPGQPLPPRDVVYVILDLLDLKDDAWMMTREQVVQLGDMLARQSAFARLFERDGIAVFKRVLHERPVAMSIHLSLTDHLNS